MESTGNTGVSYEVGFTTSCYGVLQANEKKNLQAFVLMKKLSAMNITVLETVTNP